MKERYDVRDDTANVSRNNFPERLEILQEISLPCNNQLRELKLFVRILYRNTNIKMHL